jgi:hypothetical protein
MRPIARLAASLSLALAVPLGASVVGCSATTVTGMPDGAAANPDLLPAPHPNVDFGPEPLDGGTGYVPTQAVLTTSTPGAFPSPGTGALRTVALADHAVSKDLDANLSGDTTVSAVGGKVYVIDRANGVLNVYDPAGWNTPPVSVTLTDGTIAAKTADPQSAYPIPTSTRVYVAFYANDADHAIGVVDLATPAKGIVKWIAVPKAGTALVRPSNLYFCGGNIYVLLADLDMNYTITGPSRIAIIDPKTDALVSDMPQVIALKGTNVGATSQDGIAPVDPTAGGCDQVLVTATGDAYSGKAFPLGGGVELVDLTLRASKGLLVTDSDLNASPGAVTGVSPNLAYVTVTLPMSYDMKVIAINPATKKVIGDVFGPVTFLGFAHVSPDKKLYIGVNHNKGGTPAAGIYIGATDGKAISGSAIDVGQGPFAISFY